jgi:hypothetical protein
MSDKTEDMFDELVPEWQMEWVGMPEFIQNKKEPYKKLIIRFETEKDYKEFADLIKQNLTHKTKSIWYPFKSHWGLERKVYKSES